jgi:hypothetical protein
MALCLSFIGIENGRRAGLGRCRPQLKRQRARGCTGGAKSPTGTLLSSSTFPGPQGNQEVAMNAIIYLVGLVVIVLFILSFIGLR